jgi:hypothetical protein
MLDTVNSAKDNMGLKASILQSAFRIKSLGESSSPGITHSNSINIETKL